MQRVGCLRARARLCVRRCTRARVRARAARMRRASLVLASGWMLPLATAAVVSEASRSYWGRCAKSGTCRRHREEWVDDDREE
eukprot:6205478-Pleurochrysis_carterae.AAC.7